MNLGLVRMKISLNGHELYYRFDGPKDAPIVVLAHPIGVSHRIWDWQMGALLKRWRVLRFDWLGHGDSDAPPGPYTADGYLADLVALLDFLELDKVSFVGLSAGGVIGQGLAIHHGDRLQALALCNTTAQSTMQFRLWSKRRHTALHQHGLAAVWDLTKHVCFTDAFIEAESPAYQAVRANFLENDTVGYLGGVAAVYEPPYANRLYAIRTPTLVISGSNDFVAPVDQSASLAKAIAGA